MARSDGHGRLRLGEVVEVHGPSRSPRVRRQSARDLWPVPGDPRHEREEREISLAWVRRSRSGRRSGEWRPRGQHLGHRAVAVRHHHRLPLPLRAADDRTHRRWSRSWRRIWLRTQEPEWLRLTKFFAKLMLINFAIGVVTGIVQEFQFGMNWSDYSRFVGDVFGAPLAVEALLAFFLESTFLGLWIFGWDKLPRGLHARLHVDRPPRHARLGVVHPGGQLLDAAPGRLPVQRRHRPRRAHRLLGGDVQQGPARDLPARHPRGLHDRRRLRPRRLGLALRLASGTSADRRPTGWGSGSAPGSIADRRPRGRASAATSRARS